MSPPQHEDQAPEPTVLACLDRIEPQARGRALDVACGRGRHSLELARRGYHVVALDRSSEALARLESAARDAGLAVETRRADLEAPGATLGAGTYALVLVVNYLWRPLLPAIRSAVSPRGFLVYETFTRQQARLGKPTNPDFLLEPGELLRSFAGFEILDHWERLLAGPRARAHLFARRPA